MKIRYASNSGGRGAPLRAHVAYLSREGRAHQEHAAGRVERAPELSRSVDYLSREEIAGEAKLRFYDRASSEVDARAVLIRSRLPDGQDLFIPSRLISSGIREHAQEVVTRVLGPRLDVDLVREPEVEIGLRAATSLDRELDRPCHGNCNEGSGLVCRRCDLKLVNLRVTIEERTVFPRQMHSPVSSC